MFCFSTLLSIAQSRTISLDYMVDYVVPTSRQAEVDTIKIGFAENGRFIFTNNKDLAKSFGKSIFKNKPELFNNADLGIMYDSQDGVIMMVFQSGKNEMFFRMDISNLIPAPMNVENEEFGLISENTNEKVEVNGRSGTIYSVFPTNNVNDTMDVAFDDSYSVDNNTLFGSIVKSILESMNEGDLTQLDLPDGLILKVMSKGVILLEAVQIDTTPKTLDINYSFKISE